MPEISTQNIIDRVSIEPTISCAWVDALADISKNMRLQKGQPTAILRFGDETAKLKDNGVLTISTSINGAQVEMDIPAGMWNWQKV